MRADLHPSNRILSLDVFRGLTIVLMILVNSPGTKFPYPILEHASWNGCTLADLVFPFFLFIVGITCTISLKKYRDAPIKAEVYQAIVQRTLILFLLGLFLNAYPFHFDLSTLRIYGVLQRIALCYFVCAILYLNSNMKTQTVIFTALLIGYWVLMTLIPVPGIGAKVLSKSGTWVAYFDQMIFSAPRLYEKVYDPEGFLSTFPSIATALSGVIIGHLLLSSYSNSKKCFLIAVLGMVSIFLGWLWSFDFPINKNIWTSSFVLWVSGWACLVFALCYLIIDIGHYSKWALPLKIFGMNALFAFVFHVVLLKTQLVIILPLKSGGSGNLKGYITDYLFNGYSAANASLLYSLLFLSLNFLVMAYLYKRRIFIRL